MEPRLISLVINMTANSAQRLQISPSVYHSLVILNFLCCANSSFFGGLNSQNIMLQLHHSICHLRSQFPERFG